MPLPLIVAARTTTGLIATARRLQAQWQALPPDERARLVGQARDAKRLSAELASGIRRGREAEGRPREAVTGELRVALGALAAGMSAPTATAVASSGRTHRGRLAGKAAARALAGRREEQRTPAQIPAPEAVPADDHSTADRAPRAPPPNASE